MEFPLDELIVLVAVGVVVGKRGQCLFVSALFDEKLRSVCPDTDSLLATLGWKMSGAKREPGRGIASSKAPSSSIHRGYTAPQLISAGFIPRLTAHGARNKTAGIVHAIVHASQQWPKSGMRHFDQESGSRDFGDSSSRADDDSTGDKLRFILGECVPQSPNEENDGSNPNGDTAAETVGDLLADKRKDE